MALDLNDKSGNGNTLINSGGTEVTTNLPFAAKSEAVDLESTESDYLYAGDSVSLSVGTTWTLEGWVKFESLPALGSAGAYILMGKGVNTDNTRSFFWYVPVEADNKYYLKVWLDQTGNASTYNQLSVEWSPGPSTGTWYHVAISVNLTANEVKFYVDGSQMGATQASSVTGIYDGNTYFDIGSFAHGAALFFDGIITELRVWNDVRTQTEINDNKSVELTGSEAGLVAYWPLESLSTSPTVSTDSISATGPTTGLASGNVTSDGGDTITERGFVYGLNANPTTSDNKVVVAGTTGSYNGNLTGLSPSTTYHVRAYAINGVGTSYGTDLSFTTQAGIPSIDARRVNNIGKFKATFHGFVGSVTNITELGVVFSTGASPTTSDNKVQGTIASGEIRLLMENLTPGTRYYCRMYAVSNGITSYGNTIPFVSASRDVPKHYFYKVYSKAGIYLTTWVDEVISEPSFRSNINNGPGEMIIKLARKYDDFSENIEVKLQNHIECYVVDRENHDGTLLYSGYISGYEPRVDEVQEFIEITLLSYVSELSRIILRDSAGNTKISYTNKSPEYVLRDIIDKYRRLNGRINYSSTSIGITNTLVTYTFNTNTIKECLDAIISFCPSGWYYYVDQNNIIYLQPKNVLSDHSFTLGKDVEALETFRRIEDLVNRVLITGGGDPPLYIQSENTASQDEYGVYEKKIVDQRLTDSATAFVLASSILSIYGSPEIRSNYKVLDNNGKTSNLFYEGFGYDIESIRPGHTLRILNLKVGVKTITNWDEFLWDEDYWDQTLATTAADVIQIISVQYYPDYIVLEASSRPPYIPQRIEDINESIETSVTVNNPDAPS